MSLAAVANSPLTAQLLQGIGSYLTGGADRRYKKNARSQIPGLQSDLNTGITTGDINSLAPQAIKSIMPRVNAIAGQSASKFGSRSGLALGTTLQGFNESIAPLLLALQRMRLQNNQQNKRQIYGEVSANARG